LGFDGHGLINPDSCSIDASFEGHADGFPVKFRTASSAPVVAMVETIAVADTAGVEAVMVLLEIE
jgi:hypothetical protein